MRNKFMLLVMFVGLLAFAGGVNAQDRNVEVNAGYNFVRVNPDVKSPSFTFNRTTDSNGFAVGVTDFVMPNVGVGVEGTLNFNNGGTDSSLATLLGTVEVKARQNKRFQPFINGQIGIARERALNEQAKNVFSRSDTGLAFGGNAGLDVVVNKIVSVRVAQLGYLQSRVFDEPQHNFRASAGLVLSF